MLSFHNNFTYLLKLRGFNYTSFARYLLEVGEQGTKKEDVDKLRRKLNRLGSGDVEVTIKDVRMLSTHLKALPGLLAFASHERFVGIYK